MDEFQTASSWPGNEVQKLTRNMAKGTFTDVFQGLPRAGLGEPSIALVVTDGSPALSC